VAASSNAVAPVVAASETSVPVDVAPIEPAVGETAAVVAPLDSSSGHPAGDAAPVAVVDATAASEPQSLPEPAGREEVAAADIASSSPAAVAAPAQQHDVQGADAATASVLELPVVTASSAVAAPATAADEPTVASASQADASPAQQQELQEHAQELANADLAASSTLSASAPEFVSAASSSDSAASISVPIAGSPAVPKQQQLAEPAGEQTPEQAAAAAQEEPKAVKAAPMAVEAAVPDSAAPEAIDTVAPEPAAEIPAPIAADAAPSAVPADASVPTAAVVPVDAALSVAPAADPVAVSSSPTAGTEGDISEADRLAIVDYLSSASCSLFASLPADADPDIDELALDGVLQQAGGRENTLNHLRVIDAVGRHDFLTFEQLAFALEQAVNKGTHVSEQQMTQLRDFLATNPTLLAPLPVDPAAAAAADSAAPTLSFSGLELDRLFSCRVSAVSKSVGWEALRTLLGDLVRAGRHFTASADLVSGVEFVSQGGSPVSEADREAVVELLCDLPVLQLGDEQAELESDDVDALWIAAGASVESTRQAMLQLQQQNRVFISLPLLTQAILEVRQGPATSSS